MLIEDTYQQRQIVITSEGPPSDSPEAYCHAGKDGEKANAVPYLIVWSQFLQWRNDVHFTYPNFDEEVVLSRENNMLARVHLREYLSHTTWLLQEECLKRRRSCNLDPCENLVASHRYISDQRGQVIRSARLSEEIHRNGRGFVGGFCSWAEDLGVFNKTNTGAANDAVALADLDYVLSGGGAL